MVAKQWYINCEYHLHALTVQLACIAFQETNLDYNLETNHD